MKKDILWIIICLLMIAGAVWVSIFLANEEEENKKGHIIEGVYENKYLNLGFALPEGYEFDTNNEKYTSKINKIENVSDIGFRSRFGTKVVDLLVRKEEQEEYYLYLVYTTKRFGSRSNYEALERMKNALKGAVIDNGAYEVVVTEEIVEFCDEKICCAMASYVLEESPRCIIGRYEEVEDSTMYIFAIGDSKDEAVLLMKNFYRLEAE